MTAKKYLQGIRDLEMKIKHRQTQVNFLREKTSAAQAIRYDKTIVKSSASDSKLENDIATYTDIEREIEKTKIIFENRRNKIIGEIHELEDGRHVNILFKRYVEYKRYEKIADEMGYSFDYVKHLHGEALKAFNEKILKDNTI